MPVSTDPSASTLYDILQVQPTASIEDIRLAFRELSKRYHPDTTDLPAETALRKFQQLNEAYATLSNAEQRRRYDLQLHRQRTSAVVVPTTPIAVKPRVVINSSAYLEPGDRPLSAGEVFALAILAVTFLACLLLAITLGLSRDEPLLRLPSWQTAASTERAPETLSSPAAGRSLPSPLAPTLEQQNWHMPSLEHLSSPPVEPTPTTNPASRPNRAIAPQTGNGPSASAWLTPASQLPAPPNPPVLPASSPAL
jgi:hypothetical protein